MTGQPLPPQADSAGVGEADQAADGGEHITNADTGQVVYPPQDRAGVRTPNVR